MNRRSASFVPIGVAPLVFATLACRPTPHDASVAAHESAAISDQRAAGHHDELAEAEKREYQPNLCMDDVRSSPCWTRDERVRDHERQAEYHRRAAAEHRAAARVLVEAERESCAGLSDDDRDISPFFHVRDILSAELTDDGVVVVFRPVQNLTESQLRQHVECHLARNASLGHEVPEMGYCPLVPRDVEATVSTTARGLTVVVHGTTRDAARELSKRAAQLRARVLDP